MPTDSPNLGLKYYNTTTDSHSKFLTFRSDMASPLSSNMSKIDVWAGNTNSKIKKLEDSVSGIVLNAQFKSTGYYEATSTFIESYKVGQAIIIKPDTTIDGTTMLKINDLDVKSLMKYGSDGMPANLAVGDLKINREYLFRYEGTSWVWQTATSGDQINIVGASDNILVVSEDGSIVDSGVPKSAIQDNANSISLLDTKVNEKADKTQVLTDVPANAKFTDTVTEVSNTLTETVTGKALDAVQGKALKDEVDLSNQALVDHDGDSFAHGNLRSAVVGLEDAVVDLTQQSNETATQTTTHTSKTVDDVDGIHGLKAEKKTWIPFLRGDTVAGTHTYSIQNGSYYKIGKLVVASAFCVITSKDSAMAGNVGIGGLPYVNGDGYTSVNVAGYRGCGLSTGFTQLGASLASYRNYIVLQEMGSNQPRVYIQPSAIANNFLIELTVSYYTD